MTREFVEEIVELQMMRMCSLAFLPARDAHCHHEAAFKPLPYGLRNSNAHAVFKSCCV